MALIIEDGTMPANANSYVSVSDCDSWQLARGSKIWPPAPESEDDTNEAAKEASLIRACDYLNGLSWRGRRAASGRIMAWPRQGVVDSDGYEVADNVVPQNVVYAQCYLAGVIYGGVDPQPILERGGRIASESVGSLSTSYFDDAANRDIYSAVADLLSGLALGFGDYSGTGDSSGSNGLTMGKVILG